MMGTFSFSIVIFIAFLVPVIEGGLLLHNVSREGENSVESASSEDLTWEVDLIEVTDEKPAPDNYFLFYFLCGISGMISCSVTHVALVALDGIKCRLQVDPSKYQTVVHSLRIIVSEEGLKGLFRGWVPTMIGYGMQGFVKFGLYEILKGFLIPGGLQDVHVVTLIYFVSSAIAEFFADILLAPMEATKIHMQTDDEINEEERSSSMADVIEKILKAEGPRGLYKGLPALWLRQIPYTMMKFASFERIAVFIYWHIFGVSVDTACIEVRLLVTFLAGYAAGVVCATVSHPADTVVSLLNHRRGSSVYDVARELGFSGVWKGLRPRIIMIGSMTALQWFVYDGTKVWLSIPSVSPSTGS